MIRLTILKKWFFTLLGVFLFLTGCINKGQSIFFKRQSSETTGIQFSNNIVESDSLNYFNFPYIYMGGGVAIGDINNDGLSDVFFTGNMVDNKLYLNKGNLQFEDISSKAGIIGDNRWYTGVTMVDINLDGWLDIYVCSSGQEDSKNELYINNKDLTFTEKSEAFGINDESPSIHSTFFDYDNDGDLDLFVGNYPLVPLSMGNQFYFDKIKENKHKSSGHLYRNNGNNSFTDVTHETGLQNYGLTLGVIAADFNDDGWQDLYVSNDFQVPDYFYINNTDGTFTEVLKESMQHTSMFGMGIDASDFTNDGRLDLVQLDMAPEDYKRAKMNMATMDSKKFNNIIDLGGHYQYMQNSFQVNNGTNGKGFPVFSEISRFSGIATTDWSWGVLGADFNNDGKKDIVISNGMRRDVNNNDIGHNNKYLVNQKKIKLEDIPSQALNNYIFQNQGDFKFTNVSDSSGFDYKGFSNGIAYGDLDNDGDLDLVLNNLDAQASLFENKVNKGNNFIRFKLIGPKKNPLGIGTRITIKNKEKIQLQELTLSRGFQSSVEPLVHFGLGEDEVIEEVQVKWSDGTLQTLNNIKANQVLIIEKKYADSQIKTITENSSLFKDMTEKMGIAFKHREDVFDDFEFEPLLPHRNSTLGPAIAVGDINMDGLDDFFIGNASGSPAVMYVQAEDSTFTEFNGPWQDDAEYEDTGALFFDADMDGDLDLYVVNGGNDGSKPTGYYQDRLYINNGNSFTKSVRVLPNITTSGQVVIANDYDKDGDNDLFIGGRIIPGNYPYPATSHILRNDGGPDKTLKFTEVTETIAPNLLECGLVTSALWEDFNNDGYADLILTGEWMPIRFFENRGGAFEEVTAAMGLDKTRGWWYALKSVDVDKDGDNDIIAGNLGLNYKYKTSKKSPFEIYANDFDENGKSDIVLSYSKKGRQLPLRGRECSSQQVPAISRRFKTFESFANADLLDIYGSAPLKEALNYKVDTFAHFWMENTDKLKYKMHQLPAETQFSSINAIEIMNKEEGDSSPDFFIGGNLYGSEVETPRNDGSLGLILETTNSKELKVKHSDQKRIMIKGEVRDICTIKLGREGRKGYLFAINNDTLKLVVKEVK